MSKYQVLTAEETIQYKQLIKKSVAELIKQKDSYNRMLCQNSVAKWLKTLVCSEKQTTENLTVAEVRELTGLLYSDAAKVLQMINRAN